MKYTEKNKSRILREFLKGEKIPELSKKFGVPIKTIETWQTREKWTVKRKEIAGKAFENIFDEFRFYIETSSRSALESIAIVVGMAKDEIEWLADQNPSAPRGPDFLPKLDPWIKVMSSATQVFKNILPEFKQETAEKILAELRRVK